MSEPTPTPWAISRAQIPEFYTDEWYVNDCLNVESVAIVNGEANALLIVAAAETAEQRDELLAVLEGIAKSSHGPQCPGVGARLLIFKCSCHVRMAKAAIAKAKGDDANG